MIQTLTLCGSDRWMSPNSLWAYMATENLWYLSFLISSRDSQTQKRNLWLPEGRESQGLWEGYVYTVTFKMDNQQGPIVQHKELCSMLCARLDGMGIWGRMDTCICMAEFFHCSPETTTTLLIGYTPTQNKKFEKKIMLIPSNIPLSEFIFSSTHLCGFLLLLLLSHFSRVRLCATPQTAA